MIYLWLRVAYMIVFLCVFVWIIQLLMSYIENNILLIWIDNDEMQYMLFSRCILRVSSLQKLKIFSDWNICIELYRIRTSIIRSKTSVSRHLSITQYFWLTQHHAKTKCVCRFFWDKSIDGDNNTRTTKTKAAESINTHYSARNETQTYHIAIP